MITAQAHVLAHASGSQLRAEGLQHLNHAVSRASHLAQQLLLLASLTRGIPTSLVQLNTACIIAIGVVKAGFKQTATETAVPRLLMVWAVAPVFSFACAFGLTALADRLGWL